MSNQLRAWRSRTSLPSRSSFRSLPPLASLTSLAALTPLALALLAAFPAPAGANSLCSDGPVVRECRGDQRSGIDVSAPPHTLDVLGLQFPIAPARGVAGIRLRSATSLDLALNAAASGPRLVIVTQGAAGVHVTSEGTPPVPAPDALLGIPVPGVQGLQGGLVLVRSRADITTTEDAASGLRALSSTTGYPATLKDDLARFDASGLTYAVTAVRTPVDPASASGVGVAVPARIALFRDNPDHTKTWLGFADGDSGRAGSFNVAADGSIGFAPGSDFDDLAIDTSRVVVVRVEIEACRPAAGVCRRESGELAARVTRTSQGLVVDKSAHFATWGDSARPQNENRLAPDFTGFVQGLIARVDSAGGTGGAVTAQHLEGQIDTRGFTSHGIQAESRGRAGPAGGNGGGFFTFGTVEPTDGGAGYGGGPVAVRIDGNVATHGAPVYVAPAPDNATPAEKAAIKAQRDAALAQAPVGTLALSVGGTGGTGGSGGTWYSGRRGGTGGSGGAVTLEGGGTIATDGAYASGLVALSEGGNGGTGGEGGFVTPGSRGGYGGRAGAVTVDGRWNVSTLGEEAHGVWAKSVGGNAGAGGSGGWLAGKPGGGGEASDGGTVQLTSAGAVSTLKRDAYGLFAQSIGGFGGSGGMGGGLFYSRGGDGNSAGSGSAVTLVQTASGSVVTRGSGAHAIYAQSVGGGGGAGGMAEGLVAVGGTGGAGGDGGPVVVDNAGRVETHGEHARGVVAQSIGGGGGEGGFSIGLVALGGSGAGASDGGAVTLRNSGAVSSEKIGGTALFAQSIGGGGGSGGSSGGWFSIGGKGASGGNAGTVTVTHGGATLQTKGDDASAIYAQSAGGGGGKGGNAVAVGAFVSVAVGGEGSLGGTGAAVRVDTTGGALLTEGKASHGIFAQSIGGGGGSGGFAVSASGGVGGSVAVAVGGKAGGGNDASTVVVNNAARIETQGEEADALFAESVGGGGGRGGFSVAASGSNGVAATFGIGGTGGKGGHGQAVTVSNTGTLKTKGASSVGLQAQSVGGGGGRGGFAVTASGAVVGTLNFGLGGGGDIGGNAGAVSVDNQGGITTKGHDAYGLFAQSVGGGGGSGGFTVNAGASGTASGSIGIGGKGKGGGHAAAVNVANSATIDTTGDRAIGLFAQSVGGGGGNGGFAVTLAAAGTAAGTLGIGGAADGGGHASTVTVTNSGKLVTRGADAFGLLAQSVGGGGGNGGWSVAGAGAGTGAGVLNLGGAGGAGGDGRAVRVTAEGAIDTVGARAIGLFAQSVGGGGGSGGFAVSGAGAGTGAGTFGLGGTGNGGGDAGTVWALRSGDTFTQGLQAHGVLAQSVGGGGGHGGFSVAGAGAGTGAGTLGIGGFGALGGDGKAVTLTHFGDTVTWGAQAVGVFGQSVGGGGGAGGFSIAGSGAKTGSGTLTIGGGGGRGGDADTVSVTHAGNVDTWGARAHGVVAQSVGGGGGHGGFAFGGSVATDGFTISATIGGFGGAAGDGGSATLKNYGAVATRGDDAHALVAQSVGGGGGGGGFTGTLTASLGGKPNVSIGLGGFGGAAGDAGALVDLFNDAALATSGKTAYGLFAQSVGGGGGDGGGALTVALGKHDGGLNIAANYGGSGGVAGDGHAVQAVNLGAVTTRGAQSHGIVVQSVGGGGGLGGFSLSGVAAAGSSTKDFAVGIGGFGGAGGNGGSVSLANSGAVTAYGRNAGGIVAQSVGGGGGAGGVAFAGSIGGSGAKSFGVTVGGFGGAAGSGAAVTVDNRGRIETGAVAPTPAAAISSAAALSATETKAPTLGGAPPPEPPIGEEVPQSPEARLAERNTVFRAYGVFAQSVGGGGGQGGNSIAAGVGFGGVKNTWNIDSAVAVGGSGGNGNVGGAVRLGNAAAVQTRQDDSHALFAQSVGGGGGNAGNAFTATIGLDGSSAGHSWANNTTVGGSAGAGNAGGEVRLTNQGALETRGDLADAVRAQSIGGGGGSGGDARSVNLILVGGATPKTVAGLNWKTQVQVGGTGGTGNDGGVVAVVNSGTIVTRGTGARGLFAQSVGGGGGSGGDGIIGTDTLVDYETIGASLLIGEAGGKGITGILGGLLRDLSAAVGGDQGASGHGAAVSVDNSGAITTLGKDAHAIRAQSVGGGGGEARTYFTGQDAGGRAVAGALGKIAIGGRGSAAGNGGAVTVTQRADLDTWGEGAHGIYAQSLGGGGGDAGDIARVLPDSVNIGLGLDVCVAGLCRGGNAGNGGAVTVSSSGRIATRGSAAYGIKAQSVGGGGGTAAGLSQPASEAAQAIGLIGSAGGQGSGADVTVTHRGAISTQGSGAHGVFAQSAGGRAADAPADAELYRGVGGTVQVTVGGTVHTLGDAADGVQAQSAGQAGRGNVTVTLERDAFVVGGSGDAAGVRLRDGSSNRLVNRGTLGAASGRAVVATGGDDTLENFGAVVGDVDLGGGRNALLNRLGGVLSAGATLRIGSAATLVNEGRLAPGGSAAIATTTLDGALQQGAGGVLGIDVDLVGGRSDRLDVAGAATLAGRVQVQVQRPAPVARQFVLLHADGGSDAAALALDVRPSAVARYTLLPSPNELALGLRVDFADVPGLNANQRAFGAFVNALQSAGGTASLAAAVQALYELPDAAALAGAYDRLGTEAHLAPLVLAQAANARFGQAVLSCRGLDDGGAGDVGGGSVARFVREGACGWLRAGGGHLRLARSEAALGVEHDAVTLAGGLQRTLAPDLFGALAIGFERGRSRIQGAGGDVAHATGELVQLGAALKARRGATTLAVAASGGESRQRSEREIAAGLVSAVARGEPRTDFTSLQVQLGHAVELGGAGASSSYLRPLLDLGWTRLHQRAFTETGGGALGLDVAALRTTQRSVGLALEWGTEWQRADGTRLRPLLRLGAVQRAGGEAPVLQARLLGAPNGVAPFAAQADAERTRWQLAAALEMLQTGRSTLRVGLQAEHGRRLDALEASVKAAFAF